VFVIFQKFVIVLDKCNECMNVSNRFNSIKYIEITLQIKKKSKGLKETNE